MAATAAASTNRSSLVRLHGVVLLVLVALEIYLGNALATAGSPYPAGLIDAHVATAALLIVLSAGVLARTLRLPKLGVRAIAAITLLASVAATASGSIFLWHGQSNGALDGMEGSAVVVLLGSILLIVFGSIEVPAPGPSSS